MRACVVLILMVISLGLVSCARESVADNTASMPVIGYAVYVQDAPLVDGERVSSPHMTQSFRLLGVPPAIDPLQEYELPSVTAQAIGKVVADQHVRIVADSKAVAGSDFHFSVEVPLAGIYSYAVIIRDGEAFKESIDLGCDRVCREHVAKTVRIPESWGTDWYELRVFNYATMSWESARFYVEGTAEVSSIEVHSPVDAGSALMIDIMPGSEGIGPVMWIFDQDDHLMKAFDACVERCGARAQIAVPVPATWPPGLYRLQYFDYNRKDPQERVRSVVFGVSSASSHVPLEVSLSSRRVAKGDNLKVLARASTFGAFEVVRVLQEENEVARAFLTCASYRCFGDQEVMVAIDGRFRQGKYTVAVYDYERERWQQYPFEVV